MPSLPVTLPEIPARRAGFRGAPMDLVQSRIVTDDVERLAAFYARLVRVSVVLNDYYVEVPPERPRSGSSGAGSPSTGRTRRPGRAVRGTKPRSCSTSGPATWMPNTSGSAGWELPG